MAELAMPALLDEHDINNAAHNEVSNIFFTKKSSVVVGEGNIVNALLPFFSLIQPIRALQFTIFIR